MGPRTRALLPSFRRVCVHHLRILFSGYMAMEKVACSIATEVGKLLMEPVQQHMGYLFCYRQNVKNLTKKVEKLSLERNIIQKEVATALRKGEIITDVVQYWLVQVEAVQPNAKKILDGAEGTKGMAGWFFDLCLRYKLGKKAAKNIKAIDELLSEGKFSKVSHEPPPPSIDSLLFNRDFVLFDSTRGYMKQILDELRGGGANTIGVHGPGGVGKTWLIKEVGKQAKINRNFDEVLMAVVSQSPSIRRIQTEIAEQLGLHLTEETEFVRAAKLLNRLKTVKEFVLILDDLWQRLDLTQIGVPSAVEHPGCTVVLTTRFKDVCSMMECRKMIEIKVLSNQESWKLFKIRVGADIELPTLHQVAKNIVRECGGLPLAIATLGWALREKDVDIWMSVLSQLKISMPADIPGMTKQVFNSIRLSFNVLEGNAIKSCFLHCCLYPEDYNIEVDEVMRCVMGAGLLQDVQTLEEARQSVDYMFERLKTCNLLMEGAKAAQVKMHDVVRDVAIWIASEEEHGLYYVRAGGELREWPTRVKTLENCRRISLMDNEIVQLPDKPHCPKLETLLLCGNKELRKIPDQFFLKMNAITVLDLSWTYIESLPQSISRLTNLKTLSLEFCVKLRDLSSIGRLKKLEVLNLCGFMSKMLPEDIGKLRNLRCLDLRKSEAKVSANVISRLHLLEQLYVVSGIQESVKGEGFAVVARLKKLTTLFIHVPHVRYLFQELTSGPWDSLMDFGISVGRDVDTLVLGARHGRIITLENSLPVCAGWMKVLLRKTFELVLDDCRMVECLNEDPGGIPTETFANVRYLKISNMADMSTLCTAGPPPHGFLNNLVEFEVEDCKKLTQIFPSNVLSGLGRLKFFDVSYCNEVREIFEYYYNDNVEGCTSPVVLLPQLKIMFIKNMPNMVSIWKGVMPQGSLLNMESLYLDSCSLKFMFPPVATPAFPHLQKLRIKDCNNLTVLFSMDQAQSLQQLEAIDIERCKAMTSIIMSGEEEDPHILPRLKRIELHSLPALTGFVDGGSMTMFEWPALEFISVRLCDELKRLPIGAEGAPKLESIKGSRQWFDGLEWEDEGIKARLQDLLKN